PGEAVSLAMTVRSCFSCRTSASISASGVPTPMKPPIMRVAPFGIRATASSSGIDFIVESLWVHSPPLAAHVQAMISDDAKRQGQGYQKLREDCQLLSSG